VSAALARGRGVVLLGGNFSFNNLVPKIAMNRLNLEVVGFSSPRHGFSNTAFGVRYLNRLYRNIENRHLKERLMPEPAQIPAALQRMREHLKANGTVYFTVGGRGRRTATARFLGDRIIIATGPFAMANAMGAAVLPIYTRRLTSSRYEVRHPLKSPKMQTAILTILLPCKPMPTRLPSLSFVIRVNGEAGAWCGFVNLGGQAASSIGIGW